jgi:hypothetical protein
MRTTLRLDDALLAEAKRRAIERGTTLTAVIEEALRQALAPPRRRSARPVVPTYRGSGLQPGVDLDDSADLLDRMESG